MRFFISLDAEGCTGLTSFSQVTPGHIRYKEGRYAMWKDLNALLSGAREAGATEFVVCDAHDTGRNIPLASLGEDVRVVRGIGHPLSMMAGVDVAEFDGAMFLGYHAKKGTPGVMAHTYYPQMIEKAWVGELEVGEFGLNAYAAGALGIPAIMVSGDDVVAKEAREIAPLLDIVITKEAWGEECALCYDVARTGQELHACAKLAVLEARNARPCSAPVPEITLHFTTEAGAKAASAHGRLVSPCVVLFREETYLMAFRCAIAGMEDAERA